MISTAFEWEITELESVSTTGLVVAVHWNVFATETDDQTNISLKTRKNGRVGLTSDVVTIPYDQITEDVALGWVKDYEISKEVFDPETATSSTLTYTLEEEINSECYLYFNEKRSSVIVKGLPWSTVGIAST